MGIIRELSQSVIEKIAAGEVVERPASVVKELVENSIDAGAKSITIEVVGGGKKRIAVMDDGSGMDAADLKLSVRRHATSKIAGESDLWSISTMGFRGEALAAVGAVSRLIIETKPNQPDIIEGAKVEIAGGTMSGPVVVGCPGGTKMVVSDLFFNVPARRKFLKSDNVEYGHVADVVSSLALANPSVRFDLIGEGRKRFSAPAVRGEDNVELENRIIQIIGDRYCKNLTHVEDVGDGLALRGWVSEDGRRGGKDVHIFLNRRPVKDRLLIHAISSAFGEGVPRDRYPAAVLWMEIDPSTVDVNVHPTKREVRFSNGGAVHDFVRASVRKAIAQNIPLLCKEGLGEVDREIRDLPPPAPPYKGGGGFGVQRSAYSVQPDARAREYESTRVRLNVLNQLGLTYILCEDADGTLVIIDQHAAHERLGFDHLKERYAEGQVPQQQMLIPERIELGPKEYGYISEQLGSLERAGFEIEPFGGTSLIVKAVPELLGGVSLQPIFEKISSEFEEFGNSRSVDEVVESIFALVACHGQVRGGDKLSIEEMRALVKDIEQKKITHCPHGRPIMVNIVLGEIERWFKRRG